MKEFAGGDAGDGREGAMRAVEINGTKVLLTRIDGTVRAMSAGCPHAGGPLDEGVISGDRIICPHTGVPPELGGQGIGSRLVAGALAQVRQAGLTVVPACAFVARGVAGQYP